MTGNLVYLKSLMNKSLWKKFLCESNSVIIQLTRLIMTGHDSKDIVSSLKINIILIDTMM